MNTPTKIVIGLVAVLVAVAIYGAYLFPIQKQIEQLAGTSPAGSTFSTAKFAAVAINLNSPGVNGTSTSILNTDTNDRYVDFLKLGCESLGTSRTAYTGTGLSTLQIAAGTTTTANPTSFISAASITNGFTISTSTTDVLFASSTLLLATSSYATVWPTNTYMTFFFNATNTATCSVGVGYFGS